jgi:NADH-quinone oxidoreductase subunit L
MVTAGVYMVARFAFLYDAIPQIGLFIASIGAASALLAALAASRQNDIKKILAYSTMSQLGYMFIAVGLGFYSDGIFHLFTHAFFKALLFMGAGAVILALHHEQNIFRMGSLRSRMPLVSLLMLVATLAIVGIPPFAGFFSKDAILAHAFVSGHWVLWGVGVVTAFLTAFYMFRLYFVVFVTPARYHHSPAPLPRSMTAPMVVLGLGAAFAGFLGLPEAYGGSNLFASFLALPAPEVHPSHATEYLLDGFNVLVGLAGIFLAYHLYVERIVRESDPRHGFWSALFYRAFYLDAIYETLVGETLRRLSRLGHWIDTRILDGAIMLGVGGWHLAARGFAALQTGSLRWYALVLLGGVALLSLALLNLGGVR